jgi:hypothetical protein
MHDVRGNSLPAVNASTAVTFESSRLCADKPLSYRDRVEEWYIEPLKRLHGNDGFICLMLCLPLVEKVARYLTPSAPADASFSHNSDLLAELAEILGGVSQQVALAFWKIFRNGLEHRAAPAIYDPWSYELTNCERALVVSGQRLIVNPYRFRDDIVIPLVSKHMGAWKDADYPLANVVINLKA